MTDTIRGVQPPLEFIPPAYNPTVRHIVNWALPVITQRFTTLRDVEATNLETLVDVYHQFQAGKIRVLLAFRHPAAKDPFCLGNLLWRLVPAAANQLSVDLKKPIHAHFIYDRGIPLWLGNWVTWLFPRLGGTPIHRGKIDLTGLRSARNLFANGTFPLVAAPEGATNGHNEIISPLEPGISQLGFWCVEDLRKAGRDEEVVILPLGIKYHYITPPWEALEKILTQLEADTGLEPVTTLSTNQLDETQLYKRLYRLGEYLLSLMEDYYTRFFHISLPAPAVPSTDAAATPSVLSNEVFAARLRSLLDAALQVAEQYFNLQPKGSVIDRCRRLEQAAWDCIFREDLNLETISAIERGLADRVAEEADLRVWHMRLVESFVAVTGQYVQEKFTVERFADTTLLIWDMVCRIKGGDPFKRPSLGAQTAYVTVGQPISVSERWQFYQGGRKNAKQAVAELTRDLQNALEAML
ncbi:MAG: 1-acyl-sn-glycerol-3-phosphate acyltransferase [Oscillatoriales cyanobacterium C42_A2020_001]|nr:1-acyl-sn-glycerol-3-phosphate acyltransferase [Leptolyngbyaceae cyanobacterium C42_A2020_001]